MRALFAGVIASLLIARIGSAQTADLTLAGDRCAPVLTATGRDELEQVSQRDREAYFYRNACQSSSTDLNASFEKAKVALGLSYSSRQEYCETEASKFKDYSFDYLRTSSVVEKALQTWLECVRLNRSGIIATPAIEKERFSLSLERGKKSNAIVHSVSATNGTVCRGRLLSSKKPSTKQLGLDIEVQLPVADTWNMICDRAPTPSAGVPAAVTYASTIITLDTTEGIFQIRLPDERILTEVWATEISERLDKQEAALIERSGALAQRIEEVRSAIPTRATFGAESAPWWTRNYDVWSDECPEGYAATKVKHGKQAYEVALLCRALQLRP